MSSQWIVRFNGVPVKFGELNAARTVFNLVRSLNEASVFVSEPDARHAAWVYGLKPLNLVSVETLK